VFAVNPVEVLELLGGITLSFVIIMEATIVTVSWRGLRTAQQLQAKLAPVIAVMAQIPDEQIVRGSKFLQRKFAEWSAAEAALEAAGK